MRNPQSFINGFVDSGYDVVFAERHTTTAQTFAYMTKTIVETDGVAAISLEYPPEVQVVFNRAAVGDIDKETFLKELALAQTAAIYRAAQDMLQSNTLTLQQFDRAQAIIRNRIEIIGAADFKNNRSPFSALYELLKVAAVRNVPVLANDRDLNFAVIKILSQQYPEFDMSLRDLVDRLNDRTDYELLNNQIDLESVGPVLVHRGVNHTHNIEGHATGIDDFLAGRNRDVAVIGHYQSFSGLAEAFNSLKRLGVTRIDDPTDWTILGGQWYEKSDLALFNQLMAVRRDLNAGCTAKP